MPGSDHIVWKILVFAMVLGFISFQYGSANEFDGDELTSIGMFIGTALAALWAKSPALTK